MVESSRIRILIVEDDPAHAEAIRRKLEEEGSHMEICIGDSLKKYHQALENFLPDIVLVDLNLPDGRAFDILTFPPEAGPFPILIMTSYGNERIAVESLKSGALDYLVKSPEAFADMPRMINRALREWRLLQERIRAEEELKKTHKLLQETQTITRLGGWEYDVAANRMTWTDEVYHIYGVDPAGYDPGNINRNLGFYSPNDAMVLERAFRKAVELGEPFDMQLPFIRADGQCIWVWTTGKPFLENGKVMRVAGNIMDITEKKLIEKKRLELEYQVQQAKKRESLFTMAGAIAHNFNNLFTVILANLELAKEFLPSNLPGVEEVLAAEKSARRAADLSLLMLTYVGCTAMHKESLDMAVIVRRLLPGIQSDIPVNVRLEYDIEPGEFFVTMVPIEAHKVVMNLVTNAFESLGKREGTIRIAVCFVQDDKLFIGVNHSDISPGPGPWVCLEVADNGEGMDTETQAKMFDPFFSTKFVGRGLGLAVILGIVRACEGMIFVDSELHRGTVIRVFLPATQ
jgi:signal transduction histidine kinase/DNA-binding response OmpR family regulator